MLTLLSLLLPALAAGPKASSELDGSAGKMAAELAFDGLFQTAWAEGAPGYGEGQWLELDLGRATDIKSVSIWPGNISKGSGGYDEYTRPKLIHLQVDGVDVGKPLRLLDELQRVDIELPEAVKGRKVRVVVDEVFEGIVYSDLYITEVAVNFLEADGVQRIDDWFEGKEAGKLLGAHVAQVEDNYAAYKAAEFGDREALASLMDAAIDGPPEARSQVARLTPYGFRAQAVRSSLKAQEAIRKLRDPNGIPAIELAALRAVGEDRKFLQETVEIFGAIQELQSGGDRNLPYWGDTGWNKGGLQAFTEPLALEVDQLGQVLVADTGNSRVQRFVDNGRADRQWGSPEPGVTNVWFEKGRAWYVSGAEPGDKAGQFMNPVDIDLMPGKEADGFVVIDAAKRIQIFDGEGRPVIGWNVEVRRSPEPGLGGQAYVKYVPKKKMILAVVGDDVVGYSLDSEERFRWELEDGVPNAIEVLPNGKMLAVYHDEVVRYSLDGFRFGTVIDTDVIRGGFEDMDITLDEKGKLWLFTDLGWVYKFKKPGKVDLAVRVSDKVIRRPRIAVRDGIVFYTSYDKIHQVDILQVIMDQKAEAEAEAARKGDDE